MVRRLHDNWIPKLRAVFGCRSRSKYQVPFKATARLLLRKSCIREHGPSEKFIWFLLQKANIDSVRPNGNCPLHLALSRRRSRWEDERFSPTSAITAPLIDRKVNVNQTNAAGASPLEIWLDQGWAPVVDRVNVALLLTKSGTATTIVTSKGRSIFESLTSISRSDRICLSKAFLEGDINYRQDLSSNLLEWAGVWRSAWKQPLWHLAKAGLTELVHFILSKQSKNSINMPFLSLRASFGKA
jgi:ankyrin repeat protein